MVDSPLPPTHSDYQLVTQLTNALLKQVGGMKNFEDLNCGLPSQIKDVLDFVIEADRTGRSKISELEKTEKTYIGTRIEIFIRTYLSLERDISGPLDVVVDGYSVDIKNTIGNNWMIPHEAENYPCILVKENDEKSLCSIGIFIAKPEYLTQGQNQDKKRSISAFGKKNIHWILKDRPFR